MFLTSEIAPELLWINFAILGAIILIGCISSKRFNFLHGFIVTITLLCFVTGIKVVIENNLLAGVADKTTHWIYGFYTQYDNYTQLISGMVINLVNLVKTSLPNVDFVQQESNYWILFFAPVALWLVSSIFAHLFRKRR